MIVKTDFDLMGDALDILLPHGYIVTGTIDEYEITKAPDDAGVESGSTWTNPDTIPDDATIKAKIAELRIEDNKLEYIRKRLPEYPNFEELLVALYDTDDKAALETKRAAVKTKWPKNNSGPVE